MPEGCHAQVKVKQQRLKACLLLLLHCCYLYGSTCDPWKKLANLNFPPDHQFGLLSCHWGDNDETLQEEVEEEDDGHAHGLNDGPHGHVLGKAKVGWV